MARKKQKKKKKCFAPVSRARHKKEFIESFLEFATRMGFPEISENLTEKRIELMYNIRITQPRIIITDAAENTCDNRKMVEHDVNIFINEPFTFDDPVYPTITMREFYVQGYQLISFISRLKKSDQPEDKELYNLLQKRCDKFANENDKALGQLFSYLSYLGIIYGRPDTKYFWFDNDFETKKTGKGVIIYYCLKIFSHPYEKREVYIDNEPRTIYRLGLTEYGTGLQWATIEPAKLPVQPVNTKKPLPVYMQMHAMHRLEERLDCMDCDLQLFFLNESVENYHIVTSPSGKMLLEYKFGNKILGYFVIDWVKNLLVIRTFLFITNNDTPEGARLHKIAGLQMEDKKFLQIDRLSTFLQPDVRNNNFICSLFNEAGCSELLKLNKKDFKVDLKNRVASTIETYFTKRDEYIREMQIS
jgi:hypothetical protein